MSDFREEEKLGKAYDSHLARRLMRYMKPYKGQVWLALLLTLVVTPLAALPPALFWVALDRYIVPVFKKTLPFATGMRGLGWITLINLAALLFGFAIQYLQVRVMQNVGQKTMYDLRKEIFARLQALPMSFYDKCPVGRLVTRVTTDVDALNDLFASGIVAMINDAFLLVSFVGILFYMNWRLAIATLSVLPLILLATWMFRNKARDGNRRIRTSLARINAFLNENISGMAVVQLFRRPAIALVSRPRALFCFLCDLKVVLGALCCPSNLILNALLQALHGGSLLNELRIRGAKLRRVLINLGPQRCLLEPQVLDHSQRVRNPRTARASD